MPELHAAPKEHSAFLDSLAQQSKDPRLYLPQALDWWRHNYRGPTQERFEQGGVAEAVESRVMGFYALNGCAPEITLTHLFVDRESQRRGIGGFLLEKALSQAHSLGANVVELKSDPLAKDFYTKAGAEIIEVFDEASSYPTYFMKINCSY